MEPLNICIVEDDSADIGLCQTAVDIYQETHGRQISLVACKNFAEAKKELNKSVFDGAIIDINLRSTTSDGDTVIKHIQESFFRIPTVILSGTPNATEYARAGIQVFIKGETKYSDLLDYFCKIQDTGLTRIMGGKGQIEEHLLKVFQTSLMPSMDTWTSYAENYPSDMIERSLLRFTMNHIMQLTGDDNDEFLPAEMYLCPPKDNRLHTGLIIKERDSDKQFVVLTPACDLVIRKGQIKADQILLGEIENEPEGDDKEQKKGKKKKKPSQLPWTQHLPAALGFEGGRLNFRRIHSVSKEDIINRECMIDNKKFGSLEMQISPLFLKDIVFRFSSYYARQGQPEIRTK